MLSLLYHLQDQISKTMAFAFIDHLEFISPDFTSKDARQAVSHVLERMPSDITTLTWEEPAGFPRIIWKSSMVVPR